jgi:predicted acylesterase/phospholipase RssA
VLASGSLPPQFPWTEIGHEFFWDGGLVDNAPLGDAIDAFSTDDGIERVAGGPQPLSAPGSASRVRWRTSKTGCTS